MQVGFPAFDILIWIIFEEAILVGNGSLYMLNTTPSDKKLPTTSAHCFSYSLSLSFRHSAAKILLTYYVSKSKVCFP